MLLTRNLEELHAAIALGFCEGVGSATAAKLIKKAGSPKRVFEMDKKALCSVDGVSKKIYESLSSSIDWCRVDKEVEYVQKNNINYVFISDPAYPTSLKLIDQPPPILFFTGEIEKINQSTCISIVGTRHATPYGVDMVRDLIHSIADYGPCIISGLALGIDVAAHRASVANQLTTFGIVAHGIQTIYPHIHKKVSKEMNQAGGGIITEFFSNEQPNRENFPKRNRIIAGISAATIVVEAASKGGALITAHYASRFKRKVYAVPGRYTDVYSAGCNDLIAKKIASPVNSIGSLITDLGFIKKHHHKTDHNTNVELNLDEKIIFDILQSSLRLDFDAIVEKSNSNLTNCSHLLLSMEMKGILRSLPGKIYELA